MVGMLGSGGEVAAAPDTGVEVRVAEEGRRWEEVDERGGAESVLGTLVDACERSD